MVKYKSIKVRLNFFKSMFILVLPRLLAETFLDFLYFPLWWYTRGAFRSWLWCFEKMSTGNDYLAPGLWLRNIFVPMYGQYDWEGRIISFFMRLLQTIVRFLALFIWIIICFCLFLFWLALPIFTIYGFLSIKA